MRRFVLLAAAIAVGWFIYPSTEEVDLKGLWSRADLESGTVRFYYFHSNGHGLYRFGRNDLNATQSFEYEVDDNTIELVFRKTGVPHRIRFTMEGADQIVFHEDPREGRDTRYRRTRGPMTTSRGEHPFARMWTNVERYKTGGYAFRMYQFQAPDDAGNGVGWFHEGDFDDWTTEALTYHREPRRIVLTFNERGDRHESPLFAGYVGDLPSITLEADPRGFWHRRTYLDGGRSFLEDAGLANDWSAPLQFGPWPSNR